MLRSTFNEILEPAITDYIDEVKTEIRGSIISYVFEKDGDTYFYNLEVVQVEEFPLWICMGGNKIPKDGCRMIHEEESRPLSCDYCGNSDFKKIESMEELKEWRDNYE